MDISYIAHRGVLSAAQAKAVGITGTLLRQLVAAGRCHPLHRGWYSVAKPKDEKDKLRLRTIALLREYDGQVVASHASAIVMLGLPTEAVEFGTTHLMWLEDEMPFQAFSRVRIHETVDVLQLPPRGETVHPALACVQVGTGDPRAFIVAADAALRQGLVSKADLVEACAQMRGQRGMTRVRATLDWVDHRHESPGESLTAYVVRTLGYDLEPQFEPGTTGPRGGIESADFIIKGTKVLIEFDGKVKYVAKTPEEAQQLLFREKQREDRMRDLGYEVVRLTRADLERPELVRAKIEAALTRARLRSA